MIISSFPYSFFQQTLAKWALVFRIAAAINISNVVLFTIFGSAEVQPWNDPDANAAASSRPPKDGGDAELNEEDPKHIKEEKLNNLSADSSISNKPTSDGQLNVEAISKGEEVAMTTLATSATTTTFLGAESDVDNHDKKVNEVKSINNGYSVAGVRQNNDEELVLRGEFGNNPHSSALLTSASTTALLPPSDGENVNEHNNLAGSCSAVEEVVGSTLGYTKFDLEGCFNRGFVYSNGDGAEDVEPRGSSIVRAQSPEPSSTDLDSNNPNKTTH
jgi:hypothetical protein